MSESLPSPKIFEFDQGQIHIELHPTHPDYGPRKTVLRIKAVGLPPGKYKVGETWVDEVFAEERIALWRFSSFSEVEAQIWMAGLSNSYQAIPDDY